MKAISSLNKRRPLRPILIGLAYKVVRRHEQRLQSDIPRLTALRSAVGRGSVRILRWPARYFGLPRASNTRKHETSRQRPPFIVVWNICYA
jgi:hypothetical protein